MAKKRKNTAKSHLNKLNEQEKSREEKLQQKLRKCDCSSCVWSTWTGVSFYCPWLGCIK